MKKRFFVSILIWSLLMTLPGISVIAESDFEAEQAVIVLDEEIEIPEAAEEFPVSEEIPINDFSEELQAEEVALSETSGDPAFVLGVDLEVNLGEEMDFKDSTGGDYGKEHYFRGVYLGASQCFGFARWVQYKVYDAISLGNYDEIYQEDSEKDFYHVDIDGITSLSGSSMNEENLKAMIRKAGAGAHLRTLGSAHSMIITGVSDSGFSIIQCNGHNNNEYSGYQYCYVGTYTYTWESYLEDDYGKRGIDYLEVAYVRHKSCLDMPSDGEQIYEDVFFQGWAIHPKDVEKVTAVVNGVSYTATHYNRPDVALANPGYPTGREGFSFTVPRDSLKDGENSYELTAIPKEGKEWQVAAGTIINPAIELDKEAAEVVVDDSVVLNARVVGIDPTVTWKTSNKSVAKVFNGVVTGCKAGTCVITATANKQEATCVISVVEPTIKVSPKTAKVVVGESISLKAVIKGKNKTPSWSSSNKKYATVKNGVVTGVKKGSVVIKATANKVSDTCNISVVKPTLKLNKTSLKLKKGASETLKATKNGTAKITWSSSDKSVATVKNGTVSAVSPGKAVITAKYHDVEKKCTVTVANITLKPTSVKLKAGESKTVKAKVEGASKTVKWKSSNSSIATVKSGKITAKKAGSCTITATANGVSAVCKVTVLPEAWRQAYADFLKTVKPVAYLTPKFHLSYIDGDDIPELVVTFDAAHVATPSTYTYYNGKVQLVMQYGAYGRYQYAKKKNRLYVWNMSFGYETIVFYKIINHKLEKLISFSNNIGAVTDKSKMEYHVNDDKVSQKTYDSKLKSALKGYTYLQAGYEHGYAINQENIKKVLNDDKAVTY